MNKKNIPFLKDVTKNLNGKEAFEHANILYKDFFNSPTIFQFDKKIEDFEAKIYKPATILQLAGLNLIGGKELSDSSFNFVSFACFAVDHLLWGWYMSNLAQVRIAFTLVRSSIEASIFEIAAKANPNVFKKLWNSKKGSGGFIFKNALDGKKVISSRIEALLDIAWKTTVSYSHVSYLPVMSAVGYANDEKGKMRTMTFAGQYAGPLDVTIIEQLSRVYSLASLIAVEAMIIAVYPLMNDKEKWNKEYLEFQNILNSRVPMPEHLKKYFDEELHNKLKE